PAADPASPEVAALTFEQMRATIVEQERPQRRIIELGVVEPKFSFDTPTPAGTAPWRNLHPENQVALLTAISDFSGFAKKPEPGPDVPAVPVSPAEAATASAESFRGVAQK
ncbi:MAG TPA: hypothetical protein VN903_01225, partial [Polyangia bacterium]|nr:hypothetical protein [Polyangia bacterium]